MNKKFVLILILSTLLGCSPIPKITKDEIITSNNISTGVFENQKLIFSNTPVEILLEVIRLKYDNLKNRTSCSHLTKTG